MSTTPPAGGAPEHFDAVIVGSGFGGSVTAARLAEAGWSVCVLERGRDYPPTSFARTPLEMKRNFWAPREGLHGLFDVWHFDGIDAICASGLGGGSLIYANVFLRKDEHWFVKEDLAKGGYENWPVTRAELDPHYDEVERRIGVQQFPFEKSPYDRTAKTIAYHEAADRLGHEASLPPLAVTFANAGKDPVPGEAIEEALPNLHGRTRLTCQLCGECDIGCNYGSKNTLDYTYLTQAAHAGAELRTRCEVRTFAPREGGGYEVRYVFHDPAAEGAPTDTDALERRVVTCKHLILSAGTLGTTWLLLRNKDALPGLSDQLGRGFSGNGDLLTFALNCKRKDADGKRVPRTIDASRGPVITSAIRMPDELEGGAGRGFYLQDAGYPAFGSWALQMLEGPEAILKDIPRLLHHVWNFLHGRHHSEVGGLLSTLLGDTELASGALPLLGMGRDVPDGVMSLEKEGLLEVDFDKDGASKAYFDRVRDLAREIAEQLGGDFVENPMWYEDRVITVHALGGCRMGASARAGVVDPHGRVFGHPGLHVADGSVMPGPVGPNPSLTIAALADRFATQIIADGR
jgi:cholesterol oxidase